MLEQKVQMALAVSDCTEMLDQRQDRNRARTRDGREADGMEAVACGHEDLAAQARPD